MAAWTVPKMWEGGECWIIGGGPSIPVQFGVPSDVIEAVLAKELDPSAYSPYMERIHKKHVIGINSAFLIGDWIDMVFFGDRGWWLKNRVALAKFPGLKVACHPKPSKYRSEGIKFLGRDRNHKRGISSNPSRVSWNANSGAAAISVAANAGAKRIVLLGFDMCLGANLKQHWHGLYGTANRATDDPKRLPFRRHLGGFSAIAKDAKKRGIEIINVCPNSAIEQFKKISVEEFLNENSL